MEASKRNGDFFEGYSFENDLSGIKGDDRSGMDLSMVGCYCIAKGTYSSTSLN